jgi:hypothetical protein
VTIFDAQGSPIYNNWGNAIYGAIDVVPIVGVPPGGRVELGDDADFAPGISFSEIPFSDVFEVLERFGTKVAQFIESATQEVIAPSDPDWATVLYRLASKPPE